MDSLPPPPPELAPEETRALGNLVKFHYALAALNAVGLCFIYVHWWVLSSGLQFFEGIDRPPGADENLSMFQVLEVLDVFYLFFAAPFLFFVIANFLSARRIALRTGHRFVLAVAALNLVQMPIGTAAGIYTIRTLTRPNVRAVFNFGSPPSS